MNPHPLSRSSTPLLAAVAFFILAVSPLPAEQFGLFTYQVTNGSEVEITDYPSTATGNLEIPGQIAGKPVTRIGSYAFSWCSLASVRIPSSVTSIASYAFYGCGNLTVIAVDAGNPSYSDLDGVLFNKLQTQLIQYPAGISGPYAIPSSVTSIASFAFYGCGRLTSVTIPSSVTSIGDYAFSSCGSLASVTIPPGVTSIGSYAFYYCGLTSVTIPSSITSIGSYAFSSCSSMTSVTIHSGVTSIGSEAFYGCSSLASVTIPSSVTSIGSSAFYGCSSLASVTIPSGVTSIASEAFYGCSSLTSVTIPSGVTSIGSSAFYGCSSLASVTIPSSVTSIGSRAFYNCGLTSVTIPSSVTSIGDYAFSSCSSLASVALPSSVTSIGFAAFYRCISLAVIEVDAGNPSYSDLAGVLFNKLQTQLVQYPAGISGPYAIPSTVTSIGDYAFRDCSSLTSVTIPSSITSIASYGFFGCSSLTSVTIPSSVTSIGSRAFYNCGLTSVTIPSSVTSIGDYAFSSCRSLASLTIPSSVTSIASYAFYGCRGLTSVTIHSGVTSIASYAFYECSSLTSVTIPSSVISIGDYAFSSCSSLASVTIPPGVTGIGSSAFSSCSRLASVTIPSSVTSIGSEAFYGCSSLASVTIPTSITSIASYAFYGCRSLTSVTIPSSVTSIGSYAFYHCRSLTSVTIPSSVTSIASNAFSECNSLASVTIPSNVNNIGSAAFSSCSGLTMIEVDAGNPNYSALGGALFNKLQTQLIQYPAGISGHYAIPPSVTSISDRAFDGCSSLASVTIPTSVTSIGYLAFYRCRELRSVTFLGNAPSVGSSVFYQAHAGVRVLYVPGSLGFTTPKWQGFPCEPLSTGQEIVVMSSAVSLTDGSDTVNLGNVHPGRARQATFTILNAGMVELTALAITLDGGGAGGFTASALGKTSLATGESTTFKITFSPTAIGSYRTVVHVASDDADENPFDLELLGNGLDPSFNIAAAIDLGGTSVTHGGQADWCWQTDTTHDGIDAAQSGEVGDGQSSSFSLTATGPGAVSFWWKISSIGNWDKLRFQVDGVEQGPGLSGETNWQWMRVTLGKGLHTLEWTYTNLGDVGLNYGWVDQVLLTPAPENDNFENAIVLSGADARLVCDTRGATRQAGEPGSYDSLWYQWTAPANGIVNIDSQDQNWSAAGISVFTGERVDVLTRVLTGASNYWSFEAVAGTTYHIALWRSALDQSDQQGLSLLQTPTPPTNDRFADATVLPANGVNSSSVGNTYGATVDPDEHAFDDPWGPGWSPATIWYVLTPEFSGLAEFVCSSATCPVEVAVCTGSRVSDLTRVTSNSFADTSGQTAVRWMCVAGTSYKIRVVTGFSMHDDWPYFRPYSGGGRFTTGFQRLTVNDPTRKWVMEARASLSTRVPGCIQDADLLLLQALAASPSDPEANFLRALTRFALIGKSSGFKALVASMTGDAAAELDPYAVGIVIDEDKDGDPILPSSSNPAALVSWMNSSLLPELAAIRSHLDLLPAGFSTELTGTETGVGHLEIDHADVLAISASTRALEMLVNLLSIYDLAVPLSTLIEWDKEGSLSSERVRATYTGLLRFSAGGHRAQLREQFTQIRLTMASALDFARNQRSQPLLHFWNTADIPLKDEQKWRADALAVDSSFDGATITLGNHRVNLSRFLSTTASIRDWLPVFIGQSAVANTLPDPTFGGIFPDNKSADSDALLGGLVKVIDLGTFASFVGGLLSDAPPQERGAIADPDGDGRSNFDEYCYGGDPARSDRRGEIAALFEPSGALGPEMRVSFSRRRDLTDVTYVVAVSNDLLTWDRSQATVTLLAPPVLNEDRLTETVSYAIRGLAGADPPRFVRLEVSLNPPK